MHNKGNKKAVIYKLTKILALARDVDKDKDKEFFVRKQGYPNDSLEDSEPQGPLAGHVNV